MDCDDVQVTFVLGHDTHGHAEESKTGCSGTLQTLADDVSHGGNVFGVINVRYTDRGGPGGVPDLTTIAETKIRQRKQQVEHVVTQLGTNVQPNTDEGSGEHRASLAPGDWLQLNGPFNLVNINSVTFRVADSENGRTAGSPLAAVELRTGSPTGPIVSTFNLTSTGGSTVWNSQTFPVSLAGTNELFLRLPRRRRRAGRQQPVPVQLPGVQRQGRHGRHGLRERDGRRQRAGHAVAVARHAGVLRGLHPGRRADLRRVHLGQRDLDRG